MGPRSKAAAGAAAEELARRHLEKHGLVPVTRNFRCRFGEIDLIMRDGATLVFVEVRYRQRDDYGDGIDTIDRRKQSKLVRTASYYLQIHHPRNVPPCRFDFVAVADDLDAPNIDWLQNALPGF